MFSWLSKMFGSWDRQAAAAERAAVASEEIAGMVESVRDQMRARLGIEAPAPVLVRPIAAPGEAAEAEPTRKKGRG